MTAPLFSVAPAQRMPVSVAASLAFHGIALGLFVYAAQLSRRQAAHTIANVDLMIQVKKPLPMMPHAAASAPPPAKMLDFFKMALPSIPKVEQQQLQVKAPEPLHQLKMETPRLQDRGRLEVNKLSALKLDEQRSDLNALDVGEVKAQHRSLSALAALPKLEEVGRRRVKNLPSAIRMDDERQQAQAMMQMNALTTPTHHYAAPVSETLREAQPSESNSFSRKIASILPSQPPPLEARPELHAAGDTLTKKVFAEPVKRRAQAQEMLPGQDKKGVQLEGPIKDRKIVSYQIPDFPAWAKSQGILEADVAIRFWVSPQGDVLDNMRIERTSGFGRLDREAMDALRNWKFAPLLNDEKQWGVITFKFVLE